MPKKKSIDNWIEERNKIQLNAESVSDEFAKQIWISLGVANRHIARVLNGDLDLVPAVEQEIEACFKRVKFLVDKRLEQLGGSRVS